MADWALAAAGGRVLRTSPLMEPRPAGPLSRLAAALFGTGSMAAAKQVRVS